MSQGADRGRSGKRWGTRGGSGSPTTPHAAQGGQEQKPKKGKDESGKKAGKPRSDAAESLDRFQYVNLNLLGHRVTVRVKDGSVYDGIYSGSTDGGFLIRFARKIEDRNKPVYPPQESITVKAADLVEIVAREVDFSLSVHSAERTRGSGFRTDTEISGGYDGGERELQRWTPDNDDPGLDRETFGAAGSRGWDQFSVNEKLYGYHSTYREELYTTELDKSSTAYRSRITDAQRIADEIEKGVSRNLHMQEERGHVPTGAEEIDEEDRYGAVIRNDGQGKPGDGKYVPPNKRTASDATGVPPRSLESSSTPISIGLDKVTPPSSPLSSSPSSPKLHRRESDPKLNPLLAESMRVRQTLVKGNAPLGKAATTSADPKAKGPLSSPLVGDPVAIQSLSLEVSAPKVSEEVHKKFEEYNARNRPNKEETIADLKKAKETLENSSPRLRSLSSSGGGSAAPTTPSSSSKESPNSSPSSSSSSIPPLSPVAPTTPASGGKLSKLVLLLAHMLSSLSLALFLVLKSYPFLISVFHKNPNAKAFTPLSAKAAVFVPKGMPTPPAAAASPTAVPVTSAPAAPAQIRPTEPRLEDIYNESAAQRLKAVHNMNDAPGAEQVSPQWPHGRRDSYKTLSAEEEQRLLIRQEQHMIYGARMPIPYAMAPQPLPPNSPQMIYMAGGYGGPRGPAYFVPGVTPGPLSPPTMVKGAPRGAALPGSPKGMTPGSPSYASAPQGIVLMGGYPQQPMMVPRPYAMPMDDMKSSPKGSRPVPFDPTQFVEIDPAYQRHTMAAGADSGSAHGGPEVVHGFAVPNTDALPPQP